MGGKKSISSSKNGPLVIRNIENLNEANGNIYPIEKTTVALCRCGNSLSKPFCDGKHWYSKFKDEGKVKEIGLNPDEKVAGIQKLAKSGKSENSAMSTLRTFPGFDTLVFKGAQLHKMPLNENIPVNTNGVDDVHSLGVSDVLTDSTVVADFTDIEHV
jgi:CDGSH-type Zn-finger protein